METAVYQEVYLEELTAMELTNKLAELLSLPANQIRQVSKQGPTGILILINDLVRGLGSGALLPPSSPIPAWAKRFRVDRSFSTRSLPYPGMKG